MALPTWKDNPPIWTGVKIEAGKQVPACLPAGSGRAWLVAWASIHDDPLFVELFLAKDAMEMLDILNRATGMTISPDDPLDSSCKLFLKQLEKERCERIRLYG